MQRKIWAFLALLLGVVFVLSAFIDVTGSVEAPSVAWGKDYPEFDGRGRGVLQSSDGGYLLLCTRSAQNGFTLLKTDDQGNPQWNQSYSVSIDSSNQKVIQTTDGGYAVVAIYETGFLLLKMDQRGNQQWNRSYTDLECWIGNAIIQTQDGGYALLGIGQGAPPESNAEAWLVKTDSKGNPEWTQNLGVGSASSLTHTSDGGYAIAKNSNFNLVKLDSTGTLEWSKTLADQEPNTVNSVVQTSDGGFALAGNMWRQIDGGNSYLALVKTDAHGNQQWVQYYGEGTVDSMIKTADGGFALADLNQHRLIKIDADGSEQWEIDSGGYVIQTTDGGYALTGAPMINGYIVRFGLLKLNGASLLPSETPTSTESDNPENNALLSSMTSTLIVVAVVVAIVVAVVLVWRRTRR